MNAKYIVAHKKNRTVRAFDDAHDVVGFMWGRDFSDWCIYQRQDGLPSEARLCEAVLQARDNLKTVTGESFQIQRDEHARCSK